MALIAIGALLALGSSASAVSIDDVAPLYFEGPGGWGFAIDAAGAIGRPAEVTTLPDSVWISPGDPTSGLSITISQQLGTVHQLPDAQTPSDPAIVDSTWTIENVSAGALATPLLLFTLLDPANAYPFVAEIGLDADLLTMAAHTSTGGTDYLFGSVVLPALPVGGSADITVRYIVAGPLEVQDARQLLPQMGVSLVTTYAVVPPLPEPSTLALCAAGLAGAMLLGRRRASQSETRG